MVEISETICRKLDQSQRIVCSLTTIPSRLTDPKLITVLQRLNQQTRPFDQIYLTLPKYSRRLGTEYPPVPLSVQKYCSPVTIDNDYGPITKIVGGLIQEKDPNTLIITCDDDIYYPATLVEELLMRHQTNPQAALCFSGISVGQFPAYVATVLAYDIMRKGWWFNLKLPKNRYQGRPIDILFGFSGVLYVRKFFPSTFAQIEDELLKYSYRHSDVYHHDDVLLSSYLCSQGIERRAFEAPFLVYNSYMGNALSDNNCINPKFVCAFFRALNQCQKWKLFIKREPLDFFNTITGPFFLLLIFILIILLYLVCSKRSKR